MARLRLGALVSILAFGAVASPHAAFAEDSARSCSYPATSVPASFTRGDKIYGDLHAAAAVQTGRLAVPESGPAPPSSTCAAPDCPPGVQDSDKQYFFDSYRFRNWSNANACVSITVYRNNVYGGNGPFQVAAYLGGFDPTDVERDYLGAVHGDNEEVYDFSVNVPAQSDFILVLNGAHPVGTAEALLATPYYFFVGGCGSPETGDEVPVAPLPPPLLCNDAGISDGGTSSSDASSERGDLPAADAPTSAAESPADAAIPSDQGGCNVGASASGSAIASTGLVALLLLVKRRRRGEPCHLNRER